MKFLFTFLTLFSTLTFANTPDIDAGSALTLSYSGAVQVTDVRRAFKYGVQINEADATPIATNFTCALTDICTDVDHDMVTGLKLTFTTTGTLPAPLALATTYYVIVLDGDTFKIATTLANAIAGVAIDITTVGIGVHTLHPAGLVMGTATLQGSNDCVTYFNLPLRATGDQTKSGAMTTNSAIFLSEDALTVNCVQVRYDIVAGQALIHEIRKVHDAVK